MKAGDLPGAPAPDRTMAAPNWTGAQLFLTVLVCLAILIDGFDSQIISLTLPAIARDWGIERTAFAPVVAAGTLGIAVGAMVAGSANDRYGRRWCLIVSLVVFGAASSACTICPGLLSFGFARTIAGLGLGGAMVGATTCLAEFTPPNRRNAAVSLGILCMPLGGYCASVASQRWIEQLGWKPLFLLGGIAPIAFAALLVVCLPESPSWLLARPARRSAYVAVARRLGLPLEDAAPAPLSGRPTAAGLAGLFSAAYRRDTILIWIAFFASLLSVYFVISWLPSLFVATGASLVVSSKALGYHSIGAMVGSACCIFVVQRFGTRLPMLVSGVCAIALLVALAFCFQSGLSATVILLMLGTNSFMLAMTQSLLYVVVAQAYGADSRGTGVGSAMAIGRMGAVASAFVGAWALKGSAMQYFLVDAAAMLIMLVAIMAVSRHAPPARRT